MGMDRRSFLAGGVALGAAASLQLPRAAWAQSNPNRLIYGEIGGVFDKAYKNLGARFQQKTGIELVTDVASSEPMLAKLEASAGQPSYNAVAISFDAVLRGLQRELIEPLKMSDVPSLSKVQSKIQAPLLLENGLIGGIPTHWKAIGILWRKDKVPFEITSWKDLWRPELANRISVQKMPTLGAALMLIAANIVHGGSQKDDDMEPGWAAMKALKPNIREFYPLTSAAITSLVAGDTWVSVNTLDLGLPLASENIVATIPAEGCTWAGDAFCIPKGAENRESALKFIDFMLQDANQIEWAKDAQVAPSTTVVLPPDVQNGLIENADVADKLFPIDFLHAGTNLPKWSDRWLREISG